MSVHRTRFTLGNGLAPREGFEPPAKRLFAAARILLTDWLRLELGTLNVSNYTARYPKAQRETAQFAIFSARSSTSLGSQLE